MERTPSNSSSCIHSTSKRVQQKINPIVDDHSSSPHSLLHWLKRQIQLFTPANNLNFNPNTPLIS